MIRTNRDGRGQLSRPPLLPSANRNALMHRNEVSNVARAQLRLTTRVRFAHFVSRVCDADIVRVRANEFGFNY